MKFLIFLGLLALVALMFFSLVPVFFLLLGADTEPLPRTGHIALKGAEAAGMAGVAMVVMAFLGALDYLIGAQNSLFLMVILGLLIQALAGIGMAAGAGLSNLLRNENVELEPPQAATPMVSVGQGYGGPPQQPPPGGGYPPQGGGGQYPGY